MVIEAVLGASLGSFISLLLCRYPLVDGFDENQWLPTTFALLLTISLVKIIIVARHFKSSQSVLLATFTSFMLGATFCCSTMVSFDRSVASNLRPFATWIAILCFFHWSEYAVQALTHGKRNKINNSTENRDIVSWDSFLLNHSVEYAIAAAASCAEFWIETALMPDYKNWSSISTVGLTLCVCGELLRKTAMLTAGRGFTHLISYSKKQGHELVTDGVYGLCRHPAYVGWFWWSVGSQLVLNNPLCACVSAWASWTFFNDRILEEESLLIRFFGYEYIQYQKRVPVGIPRIKGCVLESDGAR